MTVISNTSTNSNNVDRTALLSLLNNIKELFNNGPTNDPIVAMLTFIDGTLNPMIAKSGTDEFITSVSVFHDGEFISTFYNKVFDVIDTIDHPTATPNNNQQYLLQLLRIYRGLLLLINNLIVSADLTVSIGSTPIKDLNLLLVDKIIKSFNNCCTSIVLSSDQLNLSLALLYNTICKLLFNITNKFQLNIENDDDILLLFLTFYEKNLTPNNAEFYLPWLLLLNNILSSLKDSHLVSQILLNTDIVNKVLLTIYNNDKMFRFFQNTNTEPIDISHLTFIKVWKKLLISNEYISRYLESLYATNNTALLAQLLDVSTVIITSIDLWDNHDIINIMIWCIFLIKEKLYNEVKDCLLSSNTTTVDTTYPILVNVLDILTKITTFKESASYILHYKETFPLLISLLKLLNDHIPKLNPHKNPDLKPSKSTFPHCKSLLVEIFTNLTFENHQIQDLMRIHHGIELVLNNCEIDENEPFIKERSIICIKYLLANNKENQVIIRDLEEKKQKKK
ncbi:uncharacterized protein SCODWIG_01806 [Saccharomycodes ludwigii]|uniref:Ataxin-10 homolog n=1 Tax=Saccharomycodes ludwigii TaxID=36035 RepID=A0A376B5S6_9ASCO|nr:uncharacterized protein SCODWIG_01806 [Saccharomycodes ludwigii]